MSAPSPASPSPHRSPDPPLFFSSASFAVFSLLFPDRLGLNRNGADIIEISDSDQDAEDDDVASVPRPDNAAGGPRLVVDSDDDEQSEEEVGGGADEEDDDFAKAIAASKAEMDDLRAGSSSAAGPSRSRSRSRK